MTADAFPEVRSRPHFSFAPAAVFAIGTLFLAGAVHIATILLVPSFARNDGWSRLADVASLERFAEVSLTGEDAANVPGLDPLFVNGACRLQLAENPAAIAFEARDRFWSLALYDRGGTIIFSLNDRTAVEGRLDMAVVNRAQAATLRQSGSPEIEQRIVVESDSDELIALLRLFAPTEAALADARRLLAAAECVAEPVEVGPDASG